MSTRDGTRSLDPLSGIKRDRPRPSPNEAAVRMLDIQMVWDVVVAVDERPRGARRRVAATHEVAASTITEAVKRVETALAVKLFSDEPRIDTNALSAPGRVFLRDGRAFLNAFQLLRKLVQGAADERAEDVQNF